MMGPVTERVRNHLLARRLHHHLAAREKFPVCFQMLVGCFFKRSTGGFSGLVESSEQVFTSVEAFLFDLSTVGRGDIWFVRTDLHGHPCRNRGNHVREVTEDHRFLVWLPVVLPFWSLAESTARPFHFAIQLFQQKFFCRHKELHCVGLLSG